MMGEGQEAPDANHRAAFVVHDELVNGALETVHLLLHFSHDALDFVLADVGRCRGQVNTKTDEHDRE